MPRSNLNKCKDRKEFEKELILAFASATDLSVNEYASVISDRMLSVVNQLTNYLYQEGDSQ